MKYAMIPINGKEDGHGNPIIRRVLVSYTSTRTEGDQVFYEGTKIIDKDPYFSQKRSCTYTFKDSGYTLDSIENPNVAFAIISGIIDKERQYHYNISSDILKPPAIEFEADTVEQAKQKFHDRKELRD